MSPWALTSAAVTVYVPACNPVIVSVAVSCREKLAGPVIVTTAPVPAGSPMIVTSSAGFEGGPDGPSLQLDASPAVAARNKHRKADTGNMRRVTNCHLPGGGAGLSDLRSIPEW